MPAATGRAVSREDFATKGLSKRGKKKTRFRDLFVVSRVFFLVTIHDKKDHGS